MRRSSRASLAALFLLALCGAASPQEPPRPSILIFPVTGHWVSEPLAASTTTHLSQQLSRAGFDVAEAGPGGAVVRRAISEGWLTAEELDSADPDWVDEVLAIAARADARLTARVLEDDTSATVLGIVTGTVSARSVAFEAGADAGPDRAAVARELARKAAGMLTPTALSAVGADGDGRRAAAEQRYAAGKLALAQGTYRDALLEFEAALLGAPDNTEYLSCVAEARVGVGDYSGALVRLRSLAGRAPEDVEVALRLGDTALLAGKPEQAAAAFRSAEALAPDNPRVVEGLARSARALGYFERSESYYARLLPMMGVDYLRSRVDTYPLGGGAPPGAGVVEAPGQHESLPALLAHQPDDSLRMTGIPVEQLDLQLARLYLRAGGVSVGLEALRTYHSVADPPAYTEAAYLDIFPVLDEESEVIARGVQSVFASRSVQETDDEEAGTAVESLHDRSTNLSDLVEQMSVPPLLDPAHRYRVLAYNMLNQSNFEALLFLRTGDAERRRRADLLRKAFRRARAQAVQLGEELLEPEAEA